MTIAALVAAGPLRMGVTGSALKVFDLDKITASGSAPGAGGRLAVVAGTKAGTCKLDHVYENDTTPTTIIDSVGGGC